MDNSGWDPSRRLPTRLVLGVTLLVLCAPVAIDLGVSSRVRPFGYAAADTFYYLTVARNIARHGSVSFDGVHPTNGFHPLWQFVTAALHFGTEKLGMAEHTVLATVVLSLVFVAGGVALLGLAFANSGRLTPLFALLPVGVYGLLLAPFWLARRSWLAEHSMEGPFPLYGTLFSYVNGMESGAVLLSFGLCAYTQRAWNREPSALRALAFGLCLAALALSRLDHVFVSVPLLAAFVGTTRQRGRSYPDAVAAFFGLVVPVGSAVLVNLRWFGSAMPVSGSLKTSFPFVTSVHVQNWIDTWNHGSGYNLWLLQSEASLLVPMLFALGYLALTFRTRFIGTNLALGYRESARDYERFLAPVAAGVAMLATYDFLFLVEPPGSWYFPVSTLFVSLAAIALVERARPRLGRRAAALALVATSALGVWFFLRFHRQPEYHAEYARLYWVEAPELKRSFGKTPPRLVEYDDGIVSYALDAPAMSSGYTLDPEGVDALRAGRLYSLAYERGFPCAATLVYHSAKALLVDRSPEAARAYAAAVIGADVSAYEFSVKHLTSSGSLAIVCGVKR
ncbi:MAG TPA: hypothetical protein VFZ53_16345 [Polyangiaceae bacterium]